MRRGRGSLGKHGGRRNRQLRAETSDALALLLGDAPVCHPLRHGVDGCDRAVLLRPLQL